MPDFYCTFGSGQYPGLGYYAKITADSAGDARTIMHLKHKDKWSMFYFSAEEAGVDKYGLKCHAHYEVVNHVS